MINQGFVAGEASPRDVELVAGSEARVGRLAVAPAWAVLEGGITELIGVDEQVDQNDYGGSVGKALGATYSGEILNVLLISTEDGGGAVQKPDGVLYIFDADPSISPGDTAMGAAVWPTVIGKVEFETTDWHGDANGAAAYKEVAVAFHALSTLYFAWFHENATSFNDAGGDDEQLELNFWIRADSEA